ncbi:YicC family protein [Seongchinamella unica]|uniref:YicC family protein n=1 Tax=Seongchinamella unica TaxID=2547392 RepID=A0A4R5LW62_9GAMM|nr:YicC/YloC family endoribonuclease [Seongchinamella unica]TDG15706.1 YicC family protein [Seongchinamella unica]
MTAFARESSNTGQGVLTVELRTVNHRYLDCSFKLPDSLRVLETRLRELAARKLARGKVDCMIRIQPLPERSATLEINQEQLKQLAAASDCVSKVIDICKPTALEVLQFPGICSAPEQSEEELHQAALNLFETALATLADNRAREGQKLSAMIGERIDQVEAEVAVTRKRVPELLQQQRDKVISRIEELDVEVDQGRLEQELVHMSQKADVDEELDRLDAHVAEVRRALDKGGPCGRRLDFLMQELNREANTLSSKSTSSGTTQNAVELKVLIEQMREQIQNIE